MKKISFPKIKLPNLRKVNLGNLKKPNLEVVLAVLAYLPGLMVIPLIVSLMSETFVWYHVKQGILLAVVWIVTIFSFYFPILPWLLLLFTFICLIIGVVNAITQKERPLPLIGFLGE